MSRATSSESSAWPSAPRGECFLAYSERSPYLLTQYDTVDGCFPTRRAISSIEVLSASHRSNRSRSIATRTLVRMADGNRYSGHRPVDREVEARLEARALRGEVGDRALGGGDAAVEAGDLQAEELRLERRGGGLAPRRAHDELADEGRQLLVVARQAVEGRVDVLAQPQQRTARARRAEVLLVDLQQRRATALRQVDAQAQEGQLGLLAAIEARGRRRRGPRRRRRRRARPEQRGGQLVGH